MKNHDYAKSQNAKIMRWLIENPYTILTWQMAYKMFRTTKLATRISELRAKGFEVTKVPAENDNYTDYMVTECQSIHNHINFNEYIKRSIH